MGYCYNQLVVVVDWWLMEDLGHTHLVGLVGLWLPEEGCFRWGRSAAGNTGKRIPGL